MIKENYFCESDVFLKVFSYLDAQELIKCQSVSKRFNEIINESFLTQLSNYRSCFNFIKKCSEEKSCDWKCLFHSDVEFKQILENFEHDNISNAIEKIDNTAEEKYINFILELKEIGLNLKINTDQKVKIIRGIEFLKNTLIEGMHFDGYPVLKNIDENLPCFVWQENKSDLLFSENGMFLYEKNILVKKDVEKQFVDRLTMQKAFEFFKKTVPHWLKHEGCCARSYWIEGVLQDFFRVEAVSVVVYRAKQGMDFQPVSPVNWNSHLAPKVVCNGEEYMFDMLLNQPTKYSEWMQFFSGHLPKTETLSLSQSLENKERAQLLHELFRSYLIEMVAGKEACAELMFL